MNDVEMIRKVLKTHRLASKQGAYTQKCDGCFWIGWDHDHHLGDVVYTALQEARWLTTPDQLRALGTGNELNGPLIKCLGLVNPDSGRYDCGEVWEANTDGTWGILAALDSGHTWEDRAVAPEDLVLPALLLWEPTQ